MIITTGSRGEVCDIRLVKIRLFDLELWLIPGQPGDFIGSMESSVERGGRALPLLSRHAQGEPAFSESTTRLRNHHQTGSVQLSCLYPPTNSRLLRADPDEHSPSSPFCSWEAAVRH